ncbi:DUF6431 domain-containing protein [Paraburkholderia humisilvae]|nr:DUF6431 domain-containing protein [Paraburkholderia humisilvae]
MANVALISCDVYQTPYEHQEQTGHASDCICISHSRIASSRCRHYTPVVPSGSLPALWRRFLWGHGFYDRKADRRAGGDLNPVSVPRFQCSSCRRTCSRLPLYICPRRWYSWALQQQVLQLLIAGASLRRAAAIFAPGYHTVRGGAGWQRSTSASPFICAFALRGWVAAWIARIAGLPAAVRSLCARRWRGSITTASLSHDCVFRRS